MNEKCNNPCDDRGRVTEVPVSQMNGFSKLDVHDWLEDLPQGFNRHHDLVEVRFKNTRKDFFRDVNSLRLSQGDVVAVEASPGHDIGIVSLTGELVLKQLAKGKIQPDSENIRKIYRKAKPVDIEKWKEAIAQERSTMLRSRQIAADLKLDMKIGDVEYQGDRTRAIFYYIADERVDFRELIKVLADQFRVRIEMRQIGARQEAGRIGGIGSCGRQLCCSTWITNFVSVTTHAAKCQEVALNPQKLAGQCGKLKCCLNYEVPCYQDARKDIPGGDIVLETSKGRAFHQKTDIYRRIMWFSYDQDEGGNMIPVAVERVKKILEVNKKGQKMDLLDSAPDIPRQEEREDRFDNQKQRNRHKKKKHRKKR